jgi:desulfoferrodoxin-like iron-binding protein
MQSRKINFGRIKKKNYAAHILLGFFANSVIIKYCLKVKKRRLTMAVEKVGEKYRCNVCGNEVVVTEVGGGELVCCGQPMEKI